MSNLTNTTLRLGQVAVLAAGLTLPARASDSPSSGSTREPTTLEPKTEVPFRTTRNGDGTITVLIAGDAAHQNGLTFWGYNPQKGQWVAERKDFRTSSGGYVFEFTVDRGEQFTRFAVSKETPRTPNSFEIVPGKAGQPSVLKYYDMTPGTVIKSSKELQGPWSTFVVLEKGGSGEVPVILGENHRFFIPSAQLRVEKGPGGQATLTWSGVNTTDGFKVLEAPSVNSKHWTPVPWTSSENGSVQFVIGDAEARFFKVGR